ncbi:MAG: NUDIX pyrophosphatase [Balneolia bacterium]|nr:NUDIX pyrophosphatase [Balneolia bacterium]
MQNAQNPALVDVYVYSLKSNKPYFLLLKRSDEVIYAGEWRMVGGKIKTGETASEAAQREFSEETALNMQQFWCVPTVNSFFDFKRNITHHIPVFAVKCEAESVPELNHEHSDYAWVNETEAMSLVLWPEQRRCITLVSRLLEKPELSREWLIEFPSSPYNTQYRKG